MTSRMSFPPQKDMGECMKEYLLFVQDQSKTYSGLGLTDEEQTHSLLGKTAEVFAKYGVGDKTAEVLANRTMTFGQAVDEVGSILSKEFNLNPLGMRLSFAVLMSAIDICADEKEI